MRLTARRPVALVLILLGAGAPVAAQDSLLARAQRLSSAGDFREAARVWRLVLEARPSDPMALGGLVDALEAVGEWREAIEPLDRLLAIGPENPARLRQRGLWAVWGGEPDAGISLLRRAVELHPDDPDCLTALGEVLSWSVETRPEAKAILERAIRRSPGSAEALVAYGDLLSWSPATRDSARAVYQRVLSLTPGQLRARVGLANVEAWQGHAGPAQDGYAAVLADDPNHLGAIRGQGGVLVQLGRYSAAEGYLRQALELAPHDRAVSAELARAELGLGRFQSVRARLESIPESPDLRPVRDSAFRATASAAEISALRNERRGRLEINRVTARAVIAAGPMRLEALYAPAEFRDDLGAVRTETYGAGLRIDLPRLAVSAGARVREVPGLVARQWEGEVAATWRPVDVIKVRATASRLPVEETRRSVLGTFDEGELRGVVHANLIQFAAELEDLPGPFDAGGLLMAGRYTGVGLLANDRLGLEARAGLVVRRGSPWIRLSYQFSATRFDYNAETTLAQSGDHRGGYFSPAEYWMDQGLLQVAHRFGSQVLWEAEGRLGVEAVRPEGGQPVDHRGAGGAQTHLTVRLADGVDLAARYQYVNAFSAFEMSEFGMLLKLYFR